MNILLSTMGTPFNKFMQVKLTDVPYEDNV